MPGKIISGSPNVIINKLLAARLGDFTSGICDPGIPDCCPHGRTGNVCTGSPNIIINK